MSDSAATLRYAILRDLDAPDLDPLGVLFELNRGAARLHFFEEAAERDPHLSKLKREYESFDDALRTWHRSALVSALGKEGEDAD